MSDGAAVDLGISGLTDAVAIGSGGYADVYRARQSRFDRLVAVKVFVGLIVEEATIGDFERECKAIGRLSGRANIVTVYDAGITNANRPFMVMAYMAGGSLRTRLLGGPLPWQDATEIGIKVARALQAAHDAAVLHRDVKPENILLAADGEPYLADFGISRLTDATRRTRTDLSFTPAHVAPEIVTGEDVTKAVDIYSLGSTLFELMAGRPAFVTNAEDNILSVINRVVNQPVPDLLRPLGVPDAVSRVVESAMAKEPDERPPSAADLARQLEEARQRAGPTAPAPEDPWAPPATVTRVPPPAQDPWASPTAATPAPPPPPEPPLSPSLPAASPPPPAEAPWQPQAPPQPAAWQPAAWQPAAWQPAAQPSAAPAWPSLPPPPPTNPWRPETAPQPATSWQPDLPPAPPPPRRRGPVIVAIVVVVALVGGLALLGVLTQHHAPSSTVTTIPPVSATVATVAPTAPPTSATIPASTTTTVVSVAATVSSPDAAGIRQSLEAYFDAVNAHNWQAVWGQFTPRLQALDPPATLAAHAASTSDSGVVIGAIAPGSNGADIATVAFTSMQAAADGPNGDTCDHWDLDYVMVAEANGFAIDSVQPVAGSGHTSC
ncbi:MAG TPA: protein kinase [Acidimicrobiales bacterium]|nr:protein kinase [Acidimicrobiales bacterium]